jgi:hypothetical protein
MAPKDRLFAAARSASGQPQTQGEKDARHSAHAGATTTAEAASDAAASPETETHEPDAQETKPTAASAPKPEADAKEAGAAGVPEAKADPAAAAAPAPSPALTTTLEAASDADASPKTETEGAAEGGAKGVPEGEGKSYVMHATTSTERECLALCVLGCSSNKKLMRALAGVTAGSKMYLFNIQTRKARGPLIALGGTGKNLVRGAFGGRFDLHVQFQKTAKPPVVWVCGADDALPAVGPWTPPRAGGGFEARAQGQGVAAGAQVVERADRPPGVGHRRRGPEEGDRRGSDRDVARQGAAHEEEGGPRPTREDPRGDGRRGVLSERSRVRRL